MSYLMKEKFGGQSRILANAKKPVLESRYSKPTLSTKTKTKSKTPKAATNKNPASYTGSFGVNKAKQEWKDATNDIPKQFGLNKDLFTKSSRNIKAVTSNFNCKKSNSLGKAYKTGGKKVSQGSFGYSNTNRSFLKVNQEGSSQNMQSVMTANIGGNGNADQSGYLLQKHSSINKSFAPTDHSFVGQNLEYFEDANLLDYQPSRDQFDQNLI